MKRMMMMRLSAAAADHGDGDTGGGTGGLRNEFRFPAPPTPHYNNIKIIVYCSMGFFS